MRNKSILFLFLCSAFISYSQQEISWKLLSKVTFTDKYFAEFDDYFMYPTFLGAVKALEGKQVTIKGYFLDIIQEDNTFILSKGPMASCYFCGQSGPETAVEIHYTNPKNFKTDDLVTITGTLKLNRDDVNHFNYILTDCTGVLIK
ncbi:hypothetical protein [Polaribacter sp. Asnod6-C07]|uniref:hypothetical protein n=1 Tax=Polaribacter sp. Asnod6-C07 TaxID=3160582 RepID=UPI0038660DC0